MATPDEIIDEFGNQLHDGNFVTEFREGSNLIKKMTPEKARAFLNWTRRGGRRQLPNRVGLMCELRIDGCQGRDPDEAVPGGAGGGRYRSGANCPTDEWWRRLSPGDDHADHRSNPAALYGDVAVYGAGDLM